MVKAFKTPQQILNNNKKWRETHPEEEKQRHIDWRLRHPNYHKEYYDKLSMEVLIHYNGNPPRCACCGETEERFLTIDHINNDGAEHRRKVMGMNGGICPHRGKSL
jgi:hypothetical protein